jgi:DNA-binding response OmpR family regulator
MAHSSRERKRILLIDDDETIAEIIDIILTQNNYEVAVLKANISIEQIQNHLPDIILLDLHLSGYNGKIICKQLKAHPQLSLIPVILVSAAVNLEVVSKEIGANDFLAKPFGIADLVSVVTRF